MKLKEYIKELQKIADEHPDLEVVYATDDEGNSFGTVNNIPSLGHYEGGWQGEFCSIPAEDADLKINAVCIN